MLLVSPQFNLALSDLRDLVQTWLLLIPKHLAPLCKAYKYGTRGCHVWSMVMFLLLLNDSCLNDTKANLLFVQVFIPLSH